MLSSSVLGELEDQRFVLLPMPAVHSLSLKGTSVTVVFLLVPRLLYLLAVESSPCLNEMTSRSYNRTRVMVWLRPIDNDLCVTLSMMTMMWSLLLLPPPSPYQRFWRRLRILLRAVPNRMRVVRPLLSGKSKPLRVLLLSISSELC